MERLALSSLEKWKNTAGHKPLIIHGARQVGKTWLMKEFGRANYKNVVYSLHRVQLGRRLRYFSTIR